MAEKFKELIKEYRDGKITRRQFVRKALAITGSLIAAHRLLERVGAADAYGGQVDPGDPAIAVSDVEFPGKAATIFGYLARPSAAGKFPALIVIHANQGINDY